MYTLYIRRGSNKWADHELPKDILDWFCKANNLRKPNWTSDREVLVDGITYTYDQYRELT